MMLVERRLPHKLRQHIRVRSKPDTVLQRFLLPLESLKPFEAFVFQMSVAPGSQYEEVSRREITFHDRFGNLIGSVEQGIHSMRGYERNSFRRTESETVAGALSRLDVSDVTFVFALFYLHGRIESIKIYQIK